MLLGQLMMANCSHAFDLNQLRWYIRNDNCWGTNPKCFRKIESWGILSKYTHGAKTLSRATKKYGVETTVPNATCYLTPIEMSNKFGRLRTGQVG